MRLLFVYWQVQDAGSAQDIRNYAEVARRLGHEVALYVPDAEKSPPGCPLDIESADSVIFVLEWNLSLHPGDVERRPGRGLRSGLMGIGHLNLVRLLDKVPRQRRVVIDCDGMYNDMTRVGGDYNHPDVEASQWRIELCDHLADRICQPTLYPLRPNVRTFFFHAYNPAWEMPLDFSGKRYGMFYVGNNWFRWRAMQRVLQAIEPIREQVGRIGLVGRDWDAMPSWVESPLREAAYYTDPDYLKELAVEIMPPVPVGQVIRTMSKGVFNPVIVRPLFDLLGLVTCRTFETPAANTIPLFAHDPAYVEEIYGEQARELVLGEDASERMADVLRRPEHYGKIVTSIRQRLAEKYSYAVQLQQLIDIVSE